jgi:competence transcription factor ComK
VKERDDLLRAVNFSESKVRNSVLNTVSMTVSYSSRTCRIKKSSWKGLKEGSGVRVKRGIMEEDGK